MKKYKSKITEKSKNTKTIGGRAFKMTARYPVVVDETTAIELMEAIGVEGLPPVSELDEVHLLLTIKRKKL